MSETLNYIQLLQQPELISKTDVQLFHNWVEEAPFVPVYRVLLAAKYQSINHSDTAQYIEQAAFYVQDRKQLKSLLRKWQNLPIENEIIEEDKLVEETKEDIEEIETLVENTPIEEVEEIPETEIIEEEIITEETKEEVETLVENTSIEEIVETINEEITEAEITEEKEIPTIDSPEESSNITSSTEEEQITEQDDIKFLKAIGKYQIPTVVENENSDWILEAPGNGIPVISESDTIDAGFVNTDIEYLMPWMNEFEFNYVRKEKKTTPKDIQNQPVTKVQPIIEEKVIVVKEKAETSPPTSTAKNHSFDEWLSILEQKKNSDKDAPVFDLPSPEVFTEKELSQEKGNNLVSDNSIVKEKDSKEETAEVKHLAAESISYKNDMGTETLAKLYVLQGKIDLAINIYQKLMLKFPEKSSYFASQIKKLKK